MDGVSRAGEGGATKGDRRPERKRARILDLRDQAEVPSAVTAEGTGAPGLPPEVRIAIREGAVPVSSVVALEEVWPWVWVLPATDLEGTRALIREFPAEVLVVPRDPSMADVAAAAREVTPTIRVVAVGRGGDIGQSTDWAELTLPPGADPALWLVAVMGLRAGSTDSARWEWVQTMIGAVDGAYRGLRAVESDPWGDDAGVVELRQRVERYFEALLRVILDQAERSIQGFAGRSFRVADLARRMAERICASGEDVEAVRLAGLFHDVGMHVVVAPESLARPGPLGPGEWGLMRSHPDASAAATSPLRSSIVTSAILEHHERLDGSGYPRGKRGEEISVGARIVGAAGAYDAMTHPRPHRPAMSPEEALDELTGQADTGLHDPDIVKTLDSLAESPERGAP